MENMQEEGERFLLLYMAWNVAPITDEYAKKVVLFSLGLKAKECDCVIENLVKGRKIISIYSLYHWRCKQLILPSEEHLKQLKEVTAEHSKQFERLAQAGGFELKNKSEKEVRDSIIQWVNEPHQGSLKNLDIPRIFYPLFEAMFQQKEWWGLCLQLSGSILYDLFVNYSHRWENELKTSDDELLRCLCWENGRLGHPESDYLNELYSFYKNVLSGRINKEDYELTEYTMYGFCCHAFHLQSQGKYTEAMKQYQKVLKIVEEPFFFHPFYDFAYMVALHREGSLSSRKKLQVLLKKKNMCEDIALIPCRLFISVVLEENTKELIDWIKRNIEQQSPMIRYLTYLIIMHYQLGDTNQFDLSSIASLIDKDAFKLLQLDWAVDYPEFQPRMETLQKELGLQPILPPFRKQQEWEKTLDTLSALLGGETISVARVAQQEVQARIVYNINRHQQVFPRLQKSKDGSNWSKGRNVALASFKQRMTEGMTDLDNRVASCVKTFKGSWGTETYSLGGPEVLKLLIGYPYLFCDENPDLPVVIMKEEPHILLTKSSLGYKVDTNMGTVLPGSRIVVKKENDQLYRVIEMNSTQHTILMTLTKVKLFPDEAKDQLSSLLGRIGKDITVHSDLIKKEESLKQVKGSSLITVQLMPVGDGIKAELFVKPFVDLPPYCKAGEGAESVIGTVKGKRVQAMRMLKKERENFETINHLLKQISGDTSVTDTVFFDDYYQCLDLIEKLREQTKISRTEWPEGAKMSVKATVSFSQLQLSLKGSGHWFDISGELTIDEKTKMSIAELLQKVRESKGRFIALSDSEFLALSKELRKRLGELDAMLVSDKKSMRLSQFNSSLLSDMEQQGIVLKKDKRFEELQKRIEQAEILKITPPSKLKAELRDYQMEGYCWLSRLATWGAGACLADDMGLGKTVQAIALMLSRGKQGASLVIVPASVLPNWQNEIDRFAPSLSCRVLHDVCGDRTKLVEEVSEYDVLLTTYGMLVSEQELLSKRSWNVILLDEAHTIKNKDTKMSKAAMLLNGDFRLMLTGTPIQNHLSEIWNLFQFANPGLLGSFQHFNEKFILPIEKEGDKQRQSQLKKMLQPFLLRRTKAEVLDELPEKTEIVVQIDLSKEEQALYENLRQQAIVNIEKGENTPMQTLAEITKLRQAACNAALINPQLDLPSSKMETFLDLTGELIGSNHRALVFSQFTSHLALIKKELEARNISYLYLDGTIPVRERERLVREFQQGDYFLFLISLKAGGVGLNLTAADYVIHMDPWWNPAIEDQASDRAHRIGQKRPVTVYKLIATHTIEEKIICLHQTKKSLADSLLDGSNMAHKLTKEEMLDLLKGGF